MSKFRPQVYVQQANSVFAGRTRPNASMCSSKRADASSSGCPSCTNDPNPLGHGEAPSYECQTTNYYGVSHFPCCITNFPQGWPKFAMSAFVIEPAGGSGDALGAASDAIVVASLVPASAALPTSVGGSTGGKIETISAYPFGDTATVKITGTTGPVTVKVRIPGWAVKATVNGRLAANGTLVAVVCPATVSVRTANKDVTASSKDGDGMCEISVALNPEVTIEKGWGFIPNATDTSPATNGASIVRGPLVFALHPKESRVIVKNYTMDLPMRPKAVDYEISTNDTWNYLLVLPDVDTGGTDHRDRLPSFDPTPSSKWRSSFPFDDSGEYPFSVNVHAKQLKAWGYWEGSKVTAVPPASPVKCSSAADCGDTTTLRLVPFGSTNLRVSVFPWLSV